MVEEVHVYFKYLKYVSYEDTDTLWVDLAGTLHDSVDIAESLNEKRKVEQKDAKKHISPFSNKEKKSRDLLKSCKLLYTAFP